MLLLRLRSALQNRSWHISPIDKGLYRHPGAPVFMLQLRSQFFLRLRWNCETAPARILSFLVCLDPLAKRDYHWFKTVSERGEKPAPGWEGSGQLSRSSFFIARPGAK
jgi:hypothetical protein